jgi:hypothetical protein
MATQIAAPKPDGSRRPRRKTTILKHYLKGFLKRKSSTPKNEKKTKQLLPKHHLPLSCTHCNAI